MRTGNAFRTQHPYTYHLPVNALEERMIHNVQEGGVAIAAQTVGRIFVQETFQHGCCLHAQRARYTDRLLQNHLEQIVFGVLR